MKMWPKRFSYWRLTSASACRVPLAADVALDCSWRAHSEDAVSPIRGWEAKASCQSGGSSSHQIVSAAASSSLPPSNGREAIIWRTHSDDLVRSEEHTSELQSPYDLVCRLLLEKKKQKKRYTCKQV